MSSSGRGCTRHQPGRCRQSRHLYSMWTVLSRCADSVEQGRRLENLSWRLWTFVVQNEGKTTQTLPQNILTENRIPRFPHTSRLDVTCVPASVESVRPRIQSQVSRNLQSIFDGNDDSVPGHPTTIGPQPPRKSISEAEPPSPQSVLRTNVVRGFYPRTTPSTAQFPTDAIPEPTSSPAARVVQSERRPRFNLGGSCSSDEQDRCCSCNSEEDSFLRVMCFPRPSLSKQSLFDNDGMTITRSLDSNHDESAIDDSESSSDWETEESEEPSIDDGFFKQVDSRPNMTGPSLITQMFAKNGASQSTSAISRSRMATGPSQGASPNAPGEGPLMTKGMRSTGFRKPRSDGLPIMLRPNHAQPQMALSPRTTRRNMLETELTESLRRHLLWERQQKSSTANAVLKRSLTSHDVANLKQCPERPRLKSEDSDTRDCSLTFFAQANEGYHSKGW